METRPFCRMIKGGREVLIFESLVEIAGYAVQEWQVAAETSIKKRGRFAAALSGGVTPVSLYRMLARRIRDDLWARTHIFLVDERFVSPDAKESNFRIIYDTLLNRIVIPMDHIHSIATDTKSPEDSAIRYEHDILSYFRTTGKFTPSFDLMILGMGADGHTASLFPGTEPVWESDRVAVAVYPSDTARKKRVSISLRVINYARRIIFLIAGAEKAEALCDVIENSGSTLPASRVSAGEGGVTFLVDEAASRLITRKNDLK